MNVFRILNVVDYSLSFHFNGNILRLPSGASLEFNHFEELDEDLIEHIHNESIIIDFIDQLNEKRIEWTKEGF